MGVISDRDLIQVGEQEERDEEAEAENEQQHNTRGADYQVDNLQVSLVI